MKPRTTLILLVVFVALCLGYWLMILNEERVARNEVMAKRLFSFAPEDVVSLTIAREGERPTSGERRELGGWTITEPAKVPANPVIWERVAKNLAELSNERTIDEAPEDLEPYGLKDPVLTVSAATKTGKKVSVSFGSMEPTQKLRYGKVEGGPLFLATTNQFFELNRDLLWLRDRTLIKKGNAITRIDFAWMGKAKDAPADAAGPASWVESLSVVAELRKNGVWYIDKPEEAVADQDTLNKLASEIYYAVGRDFVDAPENLSDYNLDPPRARIRVKTDASDDLQTFYLGSFSTGKEEEGGVFVMREGSPAVFVVDAEMVTLLPKTPNAWHEKRLITRSGLELSAIEYTAGEQHFKLVTEKDKPWRFVEPEEAESDQVAVSQFVTTLLSLQGKDYWPEAKPEFGLDNPIIRIRLSYQGQETPSEIRVGAKTADDSAFYVTQDTGDVITLTTEQEKKLEVAQTDFTYKGLLSLPESDISEVAMVLDGTSYIFTHGEQAWKVKAPSGKIWESQSDVRALLDALSKVRAVSVEESPAPADLKPYGLENPVLTVRLNSAAADSSGKTIIAGPLMVGAPCTDNPHERYAMVAGRTDVFRVKQDIIDTVRDALRGVVDEVPAKPSTP